MTMHRFIFEIWPEPDSLDATTRALLDGGRIIPDHLAVDAADRDSAITAAKERTPAGSYPLLSGHVRSRCQPPHPSRDVPYVLDPRR